MNLNTHKKGLITLALVFFMLAPMLLAMHPVYATGTATGSLSVVQDSNSSHSPYNPTPTTTTSVSVPASPNPIGKILAFDIMINGASNVWGWAIPTVTWNPAVLTLTYVKEGPFLQDGGATGFVVGVSQNGQISGGINDAIEASATSPDTSGVLCTLYFTVAGYGNSQVNIIGTGSGQAYLHSSSVQGDPAIPVTATDASVTVTAPPLAISLVPHGATSGSTITEPSSTSPIGDTFSVDAYLAGAVGNIWGWSLDVTWNPAVLSMVSVTEGNYLSQSGNTLFVVGNIDNTAGSLEDGSIQGGVNDAYETTTTATAQAGVLATFNFVVVGYGSSNINISPGTPTGGLLTSNIPPQGIPCSLNNLQYVWTAPTPTSPLAVITVPDSPFGANSVNTFTGFGITLSGDTSTPGIDTEPPNTNCPITAYSWSVMLVGSSTPITASGATLPLTNAQIGEVAGTIVATLTVTAPVPQGASQAPGYSTTSSTTLDIQVETPYPGGVIDVWTQNGGQGPNADSSSFGPQQLVDLYAYVSYNGAPVVGKTVTFEVTGPSGTTYVSAQTDQSGIAIAQYRLPWQDSDPTQYFGEMTVSCTVDVAQAVLTDSCNFYYGYQLKLNGVTITNGATGSAPTFNRYGMGQNTIDATVSVTNTMWSSQTFWITAVVYDNNNVPVGQYEGQVTIGPATPSTGATNTWQNTNTQTYQISLTLPTWAYVGTATLYVNIFSSSSVSTLQNPLAWSPQQQASLVINAGYPNNVIVNPPVQVLNVQYTVQNDEDTGLSGYWALDNYVKTVQVWSLGSDQYEVVATYSGTFTTYNGALSPQAGTTEQTGSTGSTGTLHGEYIGTFTATSFNPNNLNTYGNIGTYNYGGSQSDIQKGTYGAQTGNTNAYDVLNAYFLGYTNFAQTQWGWTYTYGAGTAPNSIWNNNSAGNTGDIVV